MTEQRRLAAILVADVIGYSKLVGSDEAGTLARLHTLRSDVIEPAITKHAGRLFKAATLEKPDWAPTARVETIACALSGRIVEAQEALARLRAI
jgi:class 3 adenylate cyclase